MKKYLIHTHYEATEANPNFAGETRDYYIGKGGKVNDKLYSWVISNEGYDKMCHASRMLKIHQGYNKDEESRGYWKISSEIISVEV